MSFFRDMADKLLQKKEALEAEARKKATEKATEIALEQGKQAARSAVSRASKALEDALFGDDEDGPAKDSDSPDSEAAAKRPEKAARTAPPPTKTPPEDPQLAAKRRAEAQARIEAEVDDELAALKRKLKK